MNHSILTADRNTHLKIAVVALVAALGVGVIGFSARDDVGRDGMERIEARGPVVKPSKVIQITTRGGSEVR